MNKIVHNQFIVPRREWIKSEVVKIKI